jgi:hypothetical protein
VNEREDWTIREDDGPATVERKMGHRERERLERAARRHEFGRPEVTELELGKKTHKVAEVEPMDVDGVRTITVGTILWGVLTLALLPFLGNLESSGRTWWMGTAVSGFGLGLNGLEYCRRRKNALRMQPGRRRRAG